MHIKHDLMTYPFASIQHEMALDAMLDEEANTRAQRSSARFDLKTRLRKQPLTWHQRQNGLVMPKDWYLAKPQ